MINYRIVIIGDVHGNMPAFASACAAADKLGYDQLVIMGDLLTYGVQTGEVIEKAARLCSTRKAILLRGNHDTFYGKELDFTAASYFNKLPDWIRESIEYTRTSPGIELFDKLEFVDHYQSNDIYFAHANPFGPRDWHYLNTVEDYREAAKVVKDKGFRIGVFAHTHRCKAFESGCHNDIEHDFLKELYFTKETDSTWILNPGSIGQPRQILKTVFILLIVVTQQAVFIRFVPFDYDVNACISSIKNALLSEGTKERLLTFFRQHYV